MTDNADEMSKATFGLTEKNIEVIEGLLQKFGNTYHSWKMIGEKIGWCPLTACTYYQNYKEKKLIAEISAEVTKSMHKLSKYSQTQLSQIDWEDNRDNWIDYLIEKFSIE